MAKDKKFGMLNFWFMKTYDLIDFIFVWYNSEEKAKIFFYYKLLAKNNRSNIKIFYITFIYNFNMIFISTDIFKTKQISSGFARI